MIAHHFKKSFLIYLTKDEAVRLIESLNRQVVSDNCNAGRLESLTVKGEYVSVFVDDKLATEE